MPVESIYISYLSTWLHSTRKRINSTSFQYRNIGAVKLLQQPLQLFAAICTDNSDLPENRKLHFCDNQNKKKKKKKLITSTFSLIAVFVTVAPTFPTAATTTIVVVNDPERKLLHTFQTRNVGLVALCGGGALQWTSFLILSPGLRGCGLSKFVGTSSGKICGLHMR